MKDWLFPIVVAVAICACALYLLERSFVIPPRDSAETEPTQGSGERPTTPELDARRPAANPASLPPSPSVPDVEALRAQCVAETRSGNGLTPSLQSACERFAAASRGTLPAARMPPPPASISSPGRQATRRSDPNAEGGLAYVDIPMTDCARHHGYGTIDYRRCRARVAEELRSDCRRYTERANTASGEHRQHLRNWARSYCREVDRYRVTD
ncbi:hypothetical protein [Panacagrimonas perspica]|uniref:hypothetical protein n=1 Tax=Panacagrimonas perspica TaxID=381431 RepID=UPI00105CB641|nr:hypothetical protein [Panacagrimonas perspica]